MIIQSVEYVVLYYMFFLEANNFNIIVKQIKLKFM